MSEFECSLVGALSEAFGRLLDPGVMNPAWLPYLRPGQADPGGLDDEQAVVVQRVLVAPVVASLSVTTSDNGDTAGSGVGSVVFVAVDRAGAIAITPKDAGGDAHVWETIDVGEVAGRLLGVVPTGSVLAAPAQMTARSTNTALTLTREQRLAVAERLQAGVSPVEAISAQQDLDPQLRDALLSDRERAVFEISMHVPSPKGPPRLMFHLLRRWNVGEQGLYAADGPSLLGNLHVVQPGDVFATIVPLVSEGVAVATGEVAPS